MKELSIEEKAKAYDEAKARMSKAYNDNRCTIGFMNEIFPELVESEDDRMIKSINRLIRYYHDVNFPTPEGFSRKDLLDWIEKQSKQKYTKKDIDDAYLKGICDAKHELEKQSAHKSAFWSEEDEERYLSCLKRLGTGNIEQPETVNTVWLKSLKDRIQPQQEWSEEDETNRDLLYNALNKVYDIEHNIALSNWINKRILLSSKQEWSIEDKMQLDAVIHLVSSTGHIETTNWLKNLKERVQLQSIWKPSEKQMEVLLSVIIKGCSRQMVLESLYQDLKKLKE